MDDKSKTKYYKQSIYFKSKYSLHAFIEALECVFDCISVCPRSPINPEASTKRQRQNTKRVAAIYFIAQIEITVQSNWILDNFEALQRWNAKIHTAYLKSTSSYAVK